MTREEWVGIVAHVRALYPGKEFMPSYESMDAWYEKLKKPDVSLIRRAVDRYAVQNRYPPSLADIVQVAMEIWNEDKRSEFYVKI